jgi:hypothetical protein
MIISIQTGVENQQNKNASWESYETYVYVPMPGKS